MIHVLLADGREEIVDGENWTTTTEYGLRIIKVNDQDQQGVAEYHPRFWVRAGFEGVVTTVNGPASPGPDDDTAAVYEQGWRAGQEAARQEHAEDIAASKAGPSVKSRDDGDHGPEDKSVPTSDG